MTTYQKLLVLVVFALAPVDCTCDPIYPEAILDGRCLSDEIDEIRCSEDREDILQCQDTPSLEWALREDCAVKDSYCTGEGDEASCVPNEIPPECEVDETRCAPDNSAVEVCSDQGTWMVAETCDEGVTCEVGDSGPECPAASEACTVDEIPQRCDPNDDTMIQECINGFWQDYMDCSLQSPTYTCQSDGSFPYCFEPPP